MSNYLTAKEIYRDHGVKPSTLAYYRRKNLLKNIRWTLGKGKPYYDVSEVKEACPDFREKEERALKP